MSVGRDHVLIIFAIPTVLHTILNIIGTQWKNEWMNAYKWMIK